MEKATEGKGKKGEGKWETEKGRGIKIREVCVIGFNGG